MIPCPASPYQLREAGPADPAELRLPHTSAGTLPSPVQRRARDAENTPRTRLAHGCGPLSPGSELGFFLLIPSCPFLSSPLPKVRVKVIPVTHNVHSNNYFQLSLLYIFPSLGSLCIYVCIRMEYILFLGNDIEKFLDLGKEKNMIKKYIAENSQRLSKKNPPFF